MLPCQHYQAHHTGHRFSVHEWKNPSALHLPASDMINVKQVDLQNRTACQLPKGGE